VGITPEKQHPGLGALEHGPTVPGASVNGAVSLGAERAASLRERLSVLSTLGQALETARTLEELSKVLYRETATVLDTTGFILGLYDETSQVITVVHQVEAGAELPGGSFPLGEGISSQVIRSRQPRLVRRCSVELAKVQVQYATAKEGLPESLIAVPLLSHDRPVGVMSVQSYRAEAYDEVDLLTLQIIADRAAVAIHGLRRSARLDAQLQERIEELEVILAGMSEALLIVDANGCITRLNRAARDLLCGPEGVETIVLGQPLDREQWGLWPLGPRAVAQALAPMIDALRRGEARRDVEVEMRAAGVRVLSFNCAPLHNASGSLTGGVIVFRDVTGRREVERVKDEVLSVASHDLKGPVTVIKGQAQLLGRGMSLGKVTNEQLLQGLSTIVRHSDRLVDMLNLMLDLSRVESGRLDLERVEMDLVAVARGILEGVQATTSRHLLALQSTDRVEGTWDVRRIEQVLHNLLSNAVKYSPDGGEVNLTIDADDRNVTVRVSDRGVGLDPSELPRLFERFYRAEGTRRLEGSGLGLYICEAIVSAHGGRIWAESEGLGRGSCFCFTLPTVGEGAFRVGTK
jgi:signal transduction histidine kinase